MNQTVAATNNSSTPIVSHPYGIMGVYNKIGGLPMSTIRELPNGIIVNQYNIIGTPITVYEAYEPSSYTGNHSRIQRFNERVYGAIVSRRTGKREENANEAIQYILEAFPHLEQLEYGIDSFMGTIETINE